MQYDREDIAEYLIQKAGFDFISFELLLSFFGDSRQIFYAGSGIIKLISAVIGMPV